jgi:Ni,Fe-hydrogenase maturation factor
MPSFKYFIDISSLMAKSKVKGSKRGVMQGTGQINRKNNMRYVLCFGNPYIKLDSLAQEIAKKKGQTASQIGLKFISCNSPEEIFFYLDKDFIILDVAKGIRKPVYIDDISVLETSKMVSLHDFDLAFFLKLMQKIQKDKKDAIKIVAIPEKGDERKLSSRIFELLKKS